MSKERKPKAPRPLPRDVALVAGPTADGRGAHMLRLREGTLTAGEIRPAPEGRPLQGSELVRLKPLMENSPLCEVESLHGSAQPRKADSETAGTRPGKPKRSPGPARVANEAYRKNWNAIFGPARKQRRDDDWSVN
jgi:hypothetical protein